MLFLLPITKKSTDFQGKIVPLKHARLVSTVKVITDHDLCALLSALNDLHIPLYEEFPSNPSLLKLDIASHLYLKIKRYWKGSDSLYSSWPKHVGFESREERFAFICLIWDSFSISITVVILSIYSSSRQTLWVII